MAGRMDRPGIVRVMDDINFRSAPWEESGFGRWSQILSRGEAVLSAVADLPKAERPPLELHGVVSLAKFPVFVGGEWWGAIGFDDCVTVRDWSGDELAALRASATVLGAALERRLFDGQPIEADERYRDAGGAHPRGRVRGDPRGRPRTLLHQPAGGGGLRLPRIGLAVDHGLLDRSCASRRSPTRDAGRRTDERRTCAVLVRVPLPGRRRRVAVGPRRGLLPGGTGHGSDRILDRGHRDRPDALAADHPSRRPRAGGGGAREEQRGGSRALLDGIPDRPQGRPDHLGAGSSGARAAQREPSVLAGLPPGRDRAQDRPRTSSREPWTSSGMRPNGCARWTR